MLVSSGVSASWLSIHSPNSISNGHTFQITNSVSDPVSNNVADGHTFHITNSVSDPVSNNVADSVYVADILRELFAIGDNTPNSIPDPNTEFDSIAVK